MLKLSNYIPNLKSLCYALVIYQYTPYVLSIGLSGADLCTKCLIYAAHLSVEELTALECTDQTLDVRFLQQTLPLEVEDRLDQGLLPLLFLRESLLHSVWIFRRDGRLEVTSALRFVIPDPWIFWLHLYNRASLLEDGLLFIQHWGWLRGNNLMSLFWPRCRHSFVFPFFDP